MLLQISASPLPHKKRERERERERGGGKKHLITWHVCSCHDASYTTKENSKYRCKINSSAIWCVILSILLMPVFPECFQLQAGIVAVHRNWLVPNNVVCFWNQDLTGHTVDVSLTHSEYSKGRDIWHPQDQWGAGYNSQDIRMLFLTHILV